MPHAPTPQAKPGGETLTRARRSTSAKLAGLELPECFASATAVSEAHVLARPKSKRRLADSRDRERLARKCRRIERRPS